VFCKNFEDSNNVFNIVSKWGELKNERKKLLKVLDKIAGGAFVLVTTYIMITI